jgi:Zn finger protein HypA/HybF involved in hydrogenase expression
MVIKPVNISNLKTTKEIEFKCKNCGVSGKMYFENLIIDVDDEEMVKNQLRGLNCPKCGNDLLDVIVLE